MPQDPRDNYTVELTAPDISAYKAGNTGVDYVTTFDSGVAGPHVMVSAVVHGNEICGAIALDHLFQAGIRPRRGRLSFAFVNTAAYLAFDPADPTATRFVDEDFNRLWTAAVLDGPRDSQELRRARELRPVMDTVDLLLDIHSMQHATTPLMMAGPIAKGRALARGVGIPETVVTDAGHAAGKRMRDYEGFADPDSPRNALLVECGQHWEASSGTVAVESAYRFLVHVGAIDRADAGDHIPAAAPPPQQFVEVSGPVTIQTDRFRFAQDFRGMEVIPKAGTVLGHDGDTPVTTPYDNCVLIMPSRRLNKGASAVRLGRFVTD
ncbi:MAG: succinylglutamate desuccinylase/aspartoacylase family protein [Rhodobacterales bacterium]|nr:succinylglutamate desuccinylase/aspartoacylase family protein [Rhodobacterales bacterium]